MVASRQQCHDFLLTLALCHTIVVETSDESADSGGAPNGDHADDEDADDHRHKKHRKNKKKRAADDNDAAAQEHFDGTIPAYSGQSPDEVALCTTAARNGFVFVGATQSRMTLQQRDGELWRRVEYELLAVLDFSSDRRRMSVIVRDNAGRVQLLCKGADYIVAHRLRSDTARALRDATQDDINAFSRAGLRTLLLASRQLDDATYQEWAKRWHEARTRIDDGREAALDELMDEVESDLDLLGCTAIDDALQPLVPETIAYLLRANIRVWVITGDKQETAINIGYSSRLLVPNAPLVKVNATSATVARELLDDALLNYGAASGKPAPPQLALVVDGNTLTHVLSEPLAPLFLDLALRCSSVVCCR